MLAAPYLLFVLPLSLPVAVAAAAVASAGFAATLLLQERLIALTGEDVRGQALGLHATTTPAVASLAVTAMLSPGLRLSDPQIAIAGTSQPA